MLYEVLLVAVVALLIVMIPVVVAIAVLLWKMVWDAFRIRSTIISAYSASLESADEKA